MNARQRRAAQRAAISSGRRRLAKEVGRLSTADRSEVERFQDFLVDAETMDSQALRDKHREYLGLAA